MKKNPLAKQITIIIILISQITGIILNLNALK